MRVCSNILFWHSLPLNSLRRMRPRMTLECKKVENSETGLTRVARSSPQWRRPISPQAINTNNRHISSLSNLEEWPPRRALEPSAQFEAAPRTTTVLGRCVWFSYSALYSTISLCCWGFAVVPQISSQPQLELQCWSMTKFTVEKYDILLSIWSNYQEERDIWKH